MCVIHNTQNIYVTIDTLDQYWIEKAISGIITWIDFIWNWLYSWKYHRLVFFTVILSFTQSVNIPLATNVISFHSTSYVATLPVLISYKCKYIWKWFKHMFWEIFINNCIIQWTNWKIRVVWWIFTMPYPSICQFLENNICNFSHEIPKHSYKQHISIKTDTLNHNKEWQNDIRGKVHLFTSYSTLYSKICPKLTIFTGAHFVTQKYQYPMNGSIYDQIRSTSLRKTYIIISEGISHCIHWKMAFVWLLYQPSTPKFTIYHSII